MSNQYSWEKLSLEQLQELIGEGINSPSLHTAFETRLLMRRLPTLDYLVARQLITSHNDPSSTDQRDALGHALARAMTDAMPFKKDLIEIRAMLSPGGQKLFDRAERRYLKSSAYEAIETSSEELMLLVDEANSKDTTGERSKQVVDEFSSRLSESEAGQLEEFLRDRGIECWEDWYRLIDARRCIAETRPDLIKQRGFRAHKAFTNAALKLAADAKSAGPGWTPTKLLEYRAIDWSTVHPGSIIDEPGGRQVFGDRTPVRRDSNGKLMRQSVDIFGREIAANEHPDYDKIRQAAEKAFLKSSKRRN